MVPLAFSGGVVAGEGGEGDGAKGEEGMDDERGVIGAPGERFKEGVSGVSG